MEDKILKALKSGPRSNKELQTELATPATPRGYDSTLDRNLQKLKQAGKIRSARRRWLLTSFDTCHVCEGKGWVLGETTPAKRP